MCLKYITMKMITNYDCRKAFILVDKVDWYEEIDIGDESFDSAQILAKSNKYSDAYIILYKALQNIGNAILIKKFGLRSKNKNCQFQYLHEKGILSDEEIVKISQFSILRNDIYYNNATFMDLDENDYKSKYGLVVQIANKLREEIR